ncbi:MAG TPA: UvrB/UvrC motif-containing protein, partial [Bacteroidia bacterium]|nr:UvrB/UvrC motif-containing protein [Bacteroidia bacterium]
NRSLTQTAGRAARNVNGRVIMYADKITESMRKTIDETNRRREKQMKYNMENDIVPTPLNKSREMILQQTVVSGTKNVNAYIESENVTVAADPVVQYMTEEQLGSAITKTKKQMEVAAKEMDFMEAARLRDEMFELQKLLKERFGK